MNAMQAPSHATNPITCRLLSSCAESSTYRSNSSDSNSESDGDSDRGTDNSGDEGEDDEPDFSFDYDGEGRYEGNQYATLIGTVSIAMAWSVPHQGRVSDPWHTGCIPGHGTFSPAEYPSPSTDPYCVSFPSPVTSACCLIPEPILKAVVRDIVPNSSRPSRRSTLPGRALTTLSVSEAKLRRRSTHHIRRHSAAPYPHVLKFSYTRVCASRSPA
ncbi:hypothetical protein ON010_g5078 [Phytophthora cinnamomi]|nr:hypothetical protein ON010_g5078 [Phytophthora cinnamomi]